MDDTAILKFLCERGCIDRTALVYESLFGGDLPTIMAVRERVDELTPDFDPAD